MAEITSDAPSGSKNTSQPIYFISHGSPTLFDEPVRHTWGNFLPLRSRMQSGSFLGPNLSVFASVPTFNF